MQLSTDAARIHKLWSIWAAFAILVLNIAAIFVPAISAKISPTTLAGINAGLAFLVGVLRVLKQQGLIDDSSDPGLSDAIGQKSDAGAASPATTQK